MSKVPKIGDKVYVPAGDGRSGGWARISWLGKSISGGKNATFVSVLGEPAISYNWKELSRKQGTLKKSFGDQKSKSRWMERLEGEVESCGGKVIWS